MRVLGLPVALAYRLSRQRLMRLPLDIAIALAGAGLLTYAGLQFMVNRRWPAFSWMGVGLALWSVLSLALRTRGYVLFEEEVAQTTGGRGLTPFGKVPLRATGVFEVGGRRAFYAQVAGALEATELGDRILMVHVQPVSLLGLFRSREDESGWWYLFFRPEELAAVTPGRLYFGRKARPALRLTLVGARQSLVHLSFDDSETRDRVASDLLPPTMP